MTAENKSLSDRDTTTTAEFPVKRLAKVIYWAVWAQTPRGRHERRVLTNPDVQEGLRVALAEADAWRSSLASDETERRNDD